MEMHQPNSQKINPDKVVINLEPIQEHSNNPVTKVPAETRTLRRLNFSKPKSRFNEVNYPQPHKFISEPEFQPLSPHDDISSTDDDENWFDKEEEDGENRTKGKYKNKRKRKVNPRVLIEWSLFVVIMTCLISSLTLESLKGKTKWGFKIWKLCVMVMVLFCGRLVSGWLVHFLVFLVEKNFMLREKVLYFIYGLRKSFRNCVWLGLVLISWMCMFPNINHHNIIVKKVFLGLIAVFTGATIWLVKILLVKVLASSFHVTTFFDRMKESVFHHYVLDSLSGPPLHEDQMEVRNHQHLLTLSKSLPAKFQDMSRNSSNSKRFGSRRIDMEKLKKLSTRRRASAWSVKRLVSYVMSSGLSTISRTVDDFGREGSEITSEWEAKNCAQRIFKNVAKPGAKYIEEEDLLRFLKSDEVYTIFPSFEGAIETGKISKSSFRNWVVQAYIERKALAHSLNDTKTAVHQLHKLASAVVSVIVVVQFLLIIGLATTKVIFLITSQLLLVGFMFQNTGKTIFESIIFVFAMHPFDVGDRCVIDDVQMVVEEMNILTTIFLRYDMEKIYYPNSVLLTKPISNFRRSPEMAEAIEFTIDVSTSMEDIDALKRAIQIYIDSKPHYWNPKHAVIVKEIENVDKMKMALSVKHTMNHQNFGEKVARRSELLLELKKILEKLGIKYHLLPLEVHLKQVHT